MQYFNNYAFDVDILFTPVPLSNLLLLVSLLHYENIMSFVFLFQTSNSESAHMMAMMGIKTYMVVWMYYELSIVGNMGGSE